MSTLFKKRIGFYLRSIGEKSNSRLVTTLKQGALSCSAALVFVLICSFQAGRAPGSWSFTQNIGVVSIRNGKGCISLKNTADLVNRQVRIVSLMSPAPVRTGRIGAKMESCSRDAADSALQSWEVSFETETAAAELPGFGIINYKGRIRRNGNSVSADFDGDGRMEYFRSCTSTEGVHFTVWTGKPLEGQLRWHQYYYLGYDVTPTCTKAEMNSDN